MRYDLLHPKALHAALADYMGPEYKMPDVRTVRRWVTGDSPWPSWAKKATDEILGTKEKAAPHIGERLDDIYALLKLTAVATKVDPQQVQAIEVARRNVLVPRPPRRRHDGSRPKAKPRPQDE